MYDKEWNFRFNENENSNRKIITIGPYSVYEKDAPHIDSFIWTLNVPIFGICYGLQELSHHFGGVVSNCDKREFGLAVLQIESQSKLFKDIDSSTINVWMSHADQLTKLPAGFSTIASTSTAPFAAIQDETRRVFAIQFHPEVTHTPQGNYYH